MTSAEPAFYFNGHPVYVDDQVPNGTIMIMPKREVSESAKDYIARRCALQNVGECDGAPTIR